MRIFTIGGYGFNEHSFFGALDRFDVDLLADIRQRAGMRGYKYAFLNKTRLQEAVLHSGKEYRHIRELSPSSEIRALQRQSDLSSGVIKQERIALSRSFISAYCEKVLSAFDATVFAESLEAVESIAFFCVEECPEACHRSIVADHVAEYFGVDVIHLRPCVV